MRLARELGHPSPKVMVKSMTAREYRDWHEHFSNHPFSHELIDYHGAQLCWLYANANRDKDKQREPFKLSDFMYPDGTKQPEPKKPVQSMEEQKQSAAIMAAMLTGEIRGNDRPA